MRKTIGFMLLGMPVWLLLILVIFGEGAALTVLVWLGVVAVCVAVWEGLDILNPIDRTGEDDGGDENDYR